jgi:hypothetical protein
MPRSNADVYSKKLPARSALRALDRTKRTINDYAKATPIVSKTTQSPIAEMLKQPRR